MKDNLGLDSTAPAADYSGMANTLRLRLDKGRFSGHSVPLKVLSRLDGLEDALLATARARFFADNPERRHAPDHFDHQFSLSLTAVSKGSSLLDITGTEDAFDALDGITSGLEALRDQGDESGLPRSAWRALAQVFNGIDAAETLVIEGPRANVSVPAALRDAVAGASKHPSKMYSQPFFMVGSVAGVRRSRRRGATEHYEAEIRFREGTSRRSLPLSADHDVDLCQELFRDPVRLVRAVGECHRGEEGELIKVLPGIRISPVAGPKLDARFIKLREVPDGWWDGEGKRPTRRLLEQVRREAWLIVEQTSLDRPHVYPTLEGGVQLAWDTDPGSVELEANPDGAGGIMWTGLGNGDDELAPTHDAAAMRAWVRQASEPRHA